MSFDSSIFDNFPIIPLGDVVLRKIIPNEDAERYFNYIHNSDVASFLAQEDLPDTAEKAISELNYWSSLFEYRACFYWAIALADSNLIIGTCGFNNWNKSQARGEISYDLDYHHWNKGIMTRAIKAVTEFGIQEMKLQRIQATVADNNLRSMRLLTKIGFNQEGLLTKYGILHEVPRDFYMYAYTSK